MACRCSAQADIYTRAVQVSNGKAAAAAPAAGHAACSAWNGSKHPQLKLQPRGPSAAPAGSAARCRKSPLRASHSWGPHTACQYQPPARARPAAAKTQRNVRASCRCWMVLRTVLNVQSASCTSFHIPSQTAKISTVSAWAPPLHALLTQRPAGCQTAPPQLWLGRRGYSRHADTVPHGCPTGPCS